MGLSVQTANTHYSLSLFITFSKPLILSKPTKTLFLQSNMQSKLLST